VDGCDATGECKESEDGANYQRLSMWQWQRCVIQLPGDNP